jgi:carbamoyltransferase
MAVEMKILGISCFYHDSAVTALSEKGILFSIHEERISREKHDNRFPMGAITRALEYCDWKISDIDKIAFYEKPEKKLKRLIDQALFYWPKGFNLFKDRIPYFYKFKYSVENILRNDLGYKGPIVSCDHHMSHAASSYFTSPFDEALVLTIDGVGEEDTLGVFKGEGNNLSKIKSIKFPHSLGLFYSVFTQYLGFEVNEGEYKVMGLAPYGRPIYADNIRKMIQVKNGIFSLNLKYFDFSGTEKHYTKEIGKNLGISPRQPKEPVTRQHEDLACSVQHVFEEALLNVTKKLLQEAGTKNLCLAGGVALNCTANANLIRELGVKIHIQPAAGDAGGSLGTALYHYYNGVSLPRPSFSPYLGMDTVKEQIETTLKINEISFEFKQDIEKAIAEALAQQKVVGVVQGRDEWGPRSLGNRSILADPRQASMKDHLNAKIKFREEFRPFAPAVLEEDYAEYFETLGMKSSPHMLFTHYCNQPQKIPAVVHCNLTSRVQTVSEKDNPYFYRVIQNFKGLTGIPVVINTSFNLRGEPIVSSPSDALKTFYASGIDCLAVGNYWIEK